MLSLDLNLVWNIINLVVLYLLLSHFLFKPVMGIMDKRKKIIEDGLKNAQDAQNDAKKMKQEYEDALKGAKQESAQIIENARSAAKNEYDRIVGEAGDKAGNIIESAKETVRVERERTMKEIQGELAGLAVASAAKIVGKTADQDLYDQFLKEVGGTHEDTDNK